MIKNNEMGWNRRKEKWGENSEVHIIRTNFLVWTFVSDLHMIMYLYMYTQLLCELCLCIINMIQKTIFLPMNSIENILKVADREDLTMPQQLLSGPQHLGEELAMRRQGNIKAVLQDQGFHLETWGRKCASSALLFPMQTIHFLGLYVGRSAPSILNTNTSESQAGVFLLPVSSIPPTTQWLSK